jgi:hypothetical protein
MINFIKIRLINEVKFIFVLNCCQRSFEQMSRSVLLKPIPIAIFNEWCNVFIKIKKLAGHVIKLRNKYVQITETTPEKRTKYDSVAFM